MLNDLESLTRPFLANGFGGLQMRIAPFGRTKKIINLRYGVEEGGWFTKEGRGAYGVGLWKDIKKWLF